MSDSSDLFVAENIRISVAISSSWFWQISDKRSIAAMLGKHWLHFLFVFCICCWHENNWNLNHNPWIVFHIRPNIPTVWWHSDPPTFCQTARGTRWYCKKTIFFCPSVCIIFPQNVFCLFYRNTSLVISLHFLYDLFCYFYFILAILLGYSVLVREKCVTIFPRGSSYSKDSFPRTVFECSICNFYALAEFCNFCAFPGVMWWSFYDVLPVNNSQLLCGLEFLLVICPPCCYYQSLTLNFLARIFFY